MARFGREGQGFDRQTLLKLHPAAHEAIGRRLKLHYEQLYRQPLPERLAELLDELDRPAEQPAPPWHP